MIESGMNDSRVLKVKAFSLDGGGGNAAGVVLDPGDFPDRKSRQEAASRLGFSETVFASVPSGGDGADVRLEYFTPQGEVPVCGHATVAFFVALRQLRGVSKDRFRIETGAGLLDVWLEDDVVFMRQNVPEFGVYVPEDELGRCFGGYCGAQGMGARLVSTGLWDVMMPVRDAEVLAGLRPDCGAVAELSRRYGCVGVHAFALCEDGGGVSAVCRNFAPLYGIDEESATGTSSCALAAYLFSCGIRRGEYVFVQGVSMGEPSEIRVRLQVCGGAVGSIAVGGRGYVME